MSVREDAGRVLHALAEFATSEDDDSRGRHNLPGATLQHALKTLQSHDMSPERINDAVAVLERSGHVKVRLSLGTAPYSFYGVQVSPSGRVAYEESKDKQTSHKEAMAASFGDRIFIGHGRSPAWRELKDFLADTLALRWEEFNRESTAGLSTKERLQTMLDSSMFAFLVLTAEDERSDGTKIARANVIHEVGLFQGRLGFERAIVLLEDGCDEFSNITGITQIRFSPNSMRFVFEDVRSVLKREGVIAT